MEKKQFSPLFEILELNKFIYKKEHCLCYQYNWAFSNVDIKKNSILSERSLGVLILQGTTRWSRFGLSALYRQHQGHLSVGGPTYKFFFFFFELCRVLIVFFFSLIIWRDNPIRYWLLFLNSHEDPSRKRPFFTSWLVLALSGPIFNLCGCYVRKIVASTSLGC